MRLHQLLNGRRTGHEPAAGLRAQHMRVAASALVAMAAARAGLHAHDPDLHGTMPRQVGGAIRGQRASTALQAR